MTVPCQIALDEQDEDQVPRAKTNSLRVPMLNPDPPPLTRLSVASAIQTVGWPATAKLPGRSAAMYDPRLLISDS